MKRVIAILMLLCAYGVCRAYQTIEPLKEEQFAEPPTAATFRAIEMPASNLLTGAVSFQVPLYTISCHGLEIPVSLNYTSNGIKADEVAGPYGMGWVMTPDLRVTRKINGRPDDLFEYKSDLKENYPLGGLTNRIPLGDGDFSIGSHPDFDDYLRCMTESTGGGIKLPAGRYDSEYDLFTARLLDGSISFIIKNGYAYGACTDQYRIELEKSTKNGIEAVKITDESGRIYTFSTKGMRQGKQSYLVEWLLTSIKLPNGDSVYFGWSQLDIKELYPRSTHSFTYGLNGFGGDIITQGEIPSWSLDCSWPWYLKSISFNGGSLGISYVDKKIKELHVSNGSEDIVNVNFEYNSSDSRFLSKVIHSQTGEYGFEYHPRAQKYDRDWWGYCKSERSVNSNRPSVPAITFSNLDGKNSPHTSNGLSYSPSFATATAGLLKKAVYPTGAIVEWSYTSHEYSSAEAPAFALSAISSRPNMGYGGGVRVTKIILRNGEDDKQGRVRSYDYSPARFAALPWPHTFLDGKYHFGMYFDRDYRRKFQLNRGQMEVQQNSHYMDYQDGKLPVWYEEVTETDPEGKTVYKFRDFIPDNIIKEELGRRFPDSIFSIASQGPQMVERAVYALVSGKYELALKETFDFEVIEGTPYKTFNLQRRLVQTQKTIDDLAPDFDSPDFLWNLGDENLIAMSKPLGASFLSLTPEDITFSIKDSPYECKRYTVLPRRERLRSKTTVEYTPTGNIERKETYGYVGNTPIVNDVLTKVGSFESHLELEYPAAAPDLSTAMSVTSQMYRAHILAEPISSTLTIDGCSQKASKDMGVFNTSMYLPKAISCGRGDKMITMASYDFDTKGNLRLIKRPDGTKLAYIWGYNGLYPVYRIEGLDFDTLPATISGENLTLAHSSFTSPLSKNLYKPLVGVISSTDAAGLTTNYSYDAAGRLAEISVDSLGTIAKYSYVLNDGGVSRITSQKYLDSAGKNIFTTTDVYDALGRPSRSIAHTPQGKVAMLTEYDAMGRPYRKWNATPCSDISDSPADIAAAATEFYEDSAPYETTVYEPSPLSRPMKTIKPGSERHNADKATKVARSANNTTLAFSCPRYTATATGVTYNGSYEAGTLTVETVTDEDGLITQTFTDFRGLKVAEKRGNSGKNVTRYVYDGYGDLRYVLPPKLADGSYSRSDDTFEQLAFWYDYDTRGNVVLKKIPGCHEIEYIYDPAGRLVGETDGTTLSAKESMGHLLGSCMWTLHFYDALGREVISGQAYIPRSTVATLASSCLSVEWTGTGSLGGYTLSAGATAPALRSATVRRYDVAGRVVYEHTGEIERRHAYNRLGQTVQTIENYAEGASLNHTYTYTHTGQTKSEKIESTLFASPMMMQYDYDNADRLRDKWIDDGKGYVASSGMDYYFPYDSIGAFRNNYDRVGRVARVNMGDRIERTFSYQPDGALATVLTTVRKAIPLNYNFAPFRASTFGLEDDFHPIDFIPFIKNPFDDFTSKLPRTFVMGDSLFYKPSGRLSGRQVDGAAMSYTYDMYGRLTECEAHMVAEPGSDYSTSYTYDANSNITSLRRAGAIDRVGNTIETGYHSEAEFELEGNRISWGTLWSVANTFEGATGILQDDAEVYHEYDAQGRLTASNTDQIAEIEYNHLSQPVRVKFFDGKEQFSVYDNAGQLIKRYTNPGGGRAERIDQVFIGPYEFGANWTLKKIHFAGGYFTPDGKVHYHITDYQGSVGAVIRGDGVVEQRTHYYPYGEPWLEPEGDNRRLHTGKERLLWGSTPVHDFGARILPPAIPFWTTPDPCAEKYYHLGPYTFCAADPINHSDPSGCDIYFFDDEAKYLGSIVSESDIIKIEGKSGSAITEEMPLGTIEKVYDVAADDNTLTYIVVRGDAEAKATFEFFSDNLSIEMSWFSCGQAGDLGLNYISTSHKIDGDVSGEHLLNNQLGFGYSIREYNHNHPSQGLWPSSADLRFLGRMESKFGLTPTAKIYTTTSYEGLGNYKVYNKKTPTMSYEVFKSTYNVAGQKDY